MGEIGTHLDRFAHITRLKAANLTGGVVITQHGLQFTDPVKGGPGRRLSLLR